jgi:hypothetical protein
VPHQETPARDAVRVEHQVADLPLHLAKRRLIEFDVVAHVGVAVRRLRVAVLGIGHVDVDHPVEEPKRLQAVVAAGVVDQRKAQAFGRRDEYGFENLRDDVARRDEVHVVTALLLELQHHRRELVRLHLAPDALLADLPVLTEDAAQVAPAEEDRARAAPAADRILLAVVRTEAVHHRAAPGPAHGPLFGLEPIHVAVARTEITVGEVFAREARPFGELPRAMQSEIRRLERRARHSPLPRSLASPRQASRERVGLSRTASRARSDRALTQDRVIPGTPYPCGP